MSKFTLEINLGNEAMQNTYDVSRALSDLSADLLTEHEHKIICTHRGLSGKIRDANGNAVGSWVVS